MSPEQEARGEPGVESGDLSYEEFQIPPHDDLASALGVELYRRADDDVGVMRIDLQATDGSLVALVFDTPGRSVFATVDRDGARLVQVIREGATGLRVSSSRRLEIAFRTDDTLGTLVIDLDATPLITETVLFG